MQPKGKDIKRKRYSLLASLCLLTALALLLSGGAVTLARYVMDKQTQGTAVAKPFYFSSDKLAEESPYYQLDSTGGEVQLTFELRNYIDELRCTDSDFSCRYQVFSDTGEELAAGERSFSANVQKAESVSVAVDPAYFSGGREVTVSASTTAPYRESISGRFGFSKGQNQLQYSVSQQGNAVVVEISGGSGNVSLSWPEGLVPDRSNPLLEGAGPSSTTFQAESGIRYAVTFLKTDAARNYSKSDFILAGS